MEPLEAMNKAMDKIFGGEAADTVRAHCEAIEKRDAALTEQLRTETGKALVLLGEAVQRPTVARADIEQALAHLHGALAAAQELDPE